MRAKFILLALPLAAITAPASAQDVMYMPRTGDADYVSADTPAYDDMDRAENAQASMGQIAGRLSDPVVQDSVAIMVERVAGLIMNVPVGGFTDAIENARPGTVDRRLGGNATIADLAGRDAQYLPQELGERSRETAAMIGGLTRAMANLMPAVENLSREMQDQIRTAKDEGRRGRDQ